MCFVGVGCVRLSRRNWPPSSSPMTTEEGPGNQLTSSLPVLEDEKDRRLGNFDSSAAALSQQGEDEHGLPTAKQIDEETSDQNVVAIEEEPNFLPRVLAFVFPQFHRDGKTHSLIAGAPVVKQPFIHPILLTHVPNPKRNK